MLTEDPGDSGTFLNPDADFIEDATDPGTFGVARTWGWVEIDEGLGSDGFRERGYVVGVELPLTINDGPMTVDVAVF